MLNCWISLHARTFIFFLTVTVLLPLPAQTAEHFVNKQGSDENGGASRAVAFLTIQRGVEALQPGDTLTIGPGEYRENVKLTDFGDIENETLIRAEIPGTVLLRGDREPDLRWKKTPDTRFTYVADCEGPVYDLIEADTLVHLKGPEAGSGSIDAVDMTPGSYFYDQQPGKLYVSSSDFESPAKHHYRVCVRKDHGFGIRKSRGIRLQGLAATGFLVWIKSYEFLKMISGFFVEDSRNVVIDGCTAFFNGSGIVIHNGTGHVGGQNLVENCRAFGNGKEGIACHYPNDTVFRGCVSFLNGSFGIRFYANRKGQVRFADNLAWGHGYRDYEMKGHGLSGDDGFCLAERCIGLSSFHVYNVRHCIVGGDNYYRRGNHARYDDPMLSDNIALPAVHSVWEKMDVDMRMSARQAFKDREFADPLNFDFRLQGTSMFRSGGTYSQSRGPYPYRPDIRYVRPDGSDPSNGLSMATAWKTLEHAVRNLAPGDTLYLAGGRYSLSAPIQTREVSIRGRGLDVPVIEGELSVAGGRDIGFERLQFAGPVSLTGNTNVRFRDCVLSGGKAVKVNDSQNLNLTHCLVRVPVEVVASPGLDARGNLYACSPALRTDKADEVRYSSYNSYPKGTECWEIKGKPVGLAGLREKGYDAQSRVLAPEWTTVGDGPVLANPWLFKSGGPLGTAIGPHRDWEPVSIRVDGPRVSSVSDTTANIEWMTSRAAQLELRWGDTPGRTTTVELEGDGYFSYSLTGLTPGRSYHVKIKRNSSPGGLRHHQDRGVGGPTRQLAFASNDGDVRP